LELLTLLPLGCLLGASLGLAIGTRAEARQIPLVFSVIVLPMTMLGCAYYPWESLSAIPWLKVVVLVNPLVYMSEGLRAALTDLPTMSLAATYAATLAFTAALAWLGLEGFRKRVLT
jgi:ABC-2 type transport system permease protein